jgi:hypothetical protein
MSQNRRRWVVLGSFLFVSVLPLGCTRGRGGGQVTASNPAVTAPAGGALLAGDVSITWVGLGEWPDLVAIELSDDSGETFSTVIAEAEPDDGSYLWDTTTVDDGDSFRLRLTFTDELGHVRTPVTIDEDFVIDNTVPVVHLDTPSGDTALLQVVEVAWSTEEIHPATTDLRLSDDSGESFPTLLAGNLPPDGSWSWNTADFPDGEQYRLRIVGADTVGNQSDPADSIVDLVIDNTPPAVVLTSPVGGEEIEEQHTITWTTTDANPGTVEILLSSDSGGTFPTVIAAEAPDNGSFVWNTSEVAEGSTFRVQVLPTDEPGWEGSPDASAADFVIAQAPVLASSAFFRDENRNGSADAGDTLLISFDRAVEVNAAVEADFDLPVDGDTFGAGPVIASGADPTQVVVTFAFTPTIKGRQLFDAGDVDMNSPSGIDISSSMTPDAIEGALSGVDAVPSEVVDVAPGFVAGAAIGALTHETRAVVLGDLDRDGTLDLVVAHIDFTVDVLLGDGTGDFVDSGQTIGNGNTASLLAFDADGDSYLDLFLGNIDTGSGNSDELWLNDGNGTFADSAQSLGSADTTALAVGDFDGNGTLDLIAGSDGAANVLWSNDGTGNFSDAGVELGSGESPSLSVGDLDHDGALDVVIGNTSAVGEVYLGDGAGGFTDSGQELEAGQSVLGDLDRDGDLDLVKVSSSNQLGTWTNPGTGVFVDSGFRWGEATVSALALADVDGSGYSDVIVGVSDAPDEIWLNDGAGEFEVRILVENSEATTGVALGDLDSDGDLDLLAGHDGALPRAHFNSLSATFGTTSWTDSAQALAAGNTHDLAVGDVDGDGDLDLAIAVTSGVAANRIYLGDGAGVFTDSGQALGTADATGAALGDLDADGDLDLVLGLESGVPNLVFTNDGSGNFTNSGQALGSANTWRVLLGDVDRDGDLDLFCGNRSNEGDTVWLNDGGGIFTDSGQTIGSYTTLAARFGDLDLDGDLDVVIGASSGPDRTYLNDGTGTFVVGQALSATETYGLDLGDLDGDGDLDLMASTPSGGNEVWWNDGAGFFANSGQSLGSSATNDVRLADLDADGDLDAVEINWGEANAIWWNDGDGLFSLSGETLGAVISQIGVIADLDGDGDLDIVFGMVDDDVVFLNE